MNSIDLMDKQINCTNPLENTLTLYQYKETYYYVHPLTGETRWVDTLYDDLSEYLDVEQLDLIISDQVYCTTKSAEILESPYISQDVVIRQPVTHYLRNYYITVNTIDRDTTAYPESHTFSIPFKPTIPSFSKLVNFRLHKAVVAKSQYVIDRHNDTLTIQYGAEYGLSETLTFTPLGNYSAVELASRIDLMGGAVTGLTNFSCGLDISTARLTFLCDVPFRFVFSSGVATDGECRAPVGLRVSDTTNEYHNSATISDNVIKYYFTAKEFDGGTAAYRIVSGHVDVSGSQMLLLRLQQYENLLVGFIPMHDPRPPGAVVYYNNIHTGTASRGWNGYKDVHPYVVCNVTDTLGRPYNFNGINCTYVFEVTCQEMS